MPHISPPMRLPKPKFKPAPFPNSRFDGTILSLGTDERLLETRAGILRLTGCTVVSALPWQLRGVAGNKPFSLAVFGHTVPDSELHELVLHMRQRDPRTKLLLTYFQGRQAALRGMFDAVVESWTGPAALLRVVEQLLSAQAAEPPRATLH